MSSWWTIPRKKMSWFLKKGSKFLPGENWLYLNRTDFNFHMNCSWMGSGTHTTPMYQYVSPMNKDFRSPVVGLPSIRKKRKNLDLEESLKVSIFQFDPH